MPPIEFGTTRPLGAVNANSQRKPADLTDGPAQAPAQRAVARSAALDPGPAPVDVERVQLIRKAVESGNYPILPARVADAIIAAGMLLRTSK